MAESPLADGWVERLDPTSGRKYYTNKALQRSSWTRPTAPSLPAASSGGVAAAAAPAAAGGAGAGSSATLPEGWVERKDPSTGRPYYVNATKRRTSWTRPTTATAATVGATTGGGSGGAGGGDLPPNWVAKQDKSSGKTYYVNLVTKESVWTKPERDASVDAAVKAASSLPPNWVQQRDASSGRHYYYNTITRETRWNKPAAEGAGDGSASASDEEEEDDGSLPEGWQERKDPATGRSYYTNKELRQTTWERPTKKAARAAADHADATAAAAAPKALPPNWEKRTDETSGRTFYYNTETRATSWELPTAESDRQTTALPEGWAEKVDPASGRTYYFNRETHQTQWDRPAPVVAIAPKQRYRENIVGQSFDPAGGDYERRSYPKSDEARALLAGVCARSFIFNGLGSEEMDQLVDAFREVRLSRGDTVIKQGENGDNFYIVQSGAFDVTVEGVGKVSQCGSGDSFGEKALLYNCPRAATVTAVDNALIWALDRATFRHMVAFADGSKTARMTDALRRVPLLESLDDHQLGQVAQVVKEIDYAPGSTIIRKGDVGEEFFMVQHGNVLVTGLPGRPDLELSAGAYFGERALLQDQPRAATVVAATQVRCLVLGRAAFTSLLGPLHELLDNKLATTVLSSVPILQVLSGVERAAVIPAFRTISFPDGAVIRSPGPCDTFYVMKEGNARGRAPDGTVTTYGGGEWFADQALRDDVHLNQTIRAIGPCAVFAITRAEFEARVGTLRGIQARPSVMMRTRELEALQNKFGAGAQLPASTMDAVAEEEDEEDDGKGGSGAGGYRLEDLEHIAFLGAGAFGRVTLVKHRPTKTAWALKRLRKQQVVETNQVSNVMNEKNIMKQLDHPFILKLAATFQDKDHLYMLLERVLGGELFSYLANTSAGVVSDDHARFYAGGVLLGLEHMHDKNILYRDLKPENIMIDSEGYLRIIDFGFAKVVPDRTYTICGTPEYLAPELVLGRGHHKGVDFWAVGILIYEMLVGYSPFADRPGNDQMVVCRNIVEAKLVVPKVVPKAAKDLITKLLNRTPTSRLGCKRGGMGDVRKHKWFKGFDWAALLQKRIDPPWVPPLSGDFDTTHFEEDPGDEPCPYHDDGSGKFDDF